MRILGGIVLLLTIVLVYILSRPMGALPAIGKLLDPIGGFWANADAVDKDLSEELQLRGLKGKVSVWYDDRMVPHIHAANEDDVYYVQGYVHARFRLWQMDMQTRAAAGRVSEVVGDKALTFDRTQRRKGMVYGAEQSLKAMNVNPATRKMLDAYTSGVNDYIAALHVHDLPVEYKLMGFSPEPWTNLKTALLLKYMADDLTGYTEDIPLTMLRDMLDETTFNYLFPQRIEGSTPVIPHGTAFHQPSQQVPPVPADSTIWTHFNSADFDMEPQATDGKGSNNWALSGSKTKNGAAILCNDPHLGLNLPSLWFEVQLQSPSMNVYGVSLPGAPGVIIGFNDQIAWGFTNNYRDVKDFYAIEPADADNYWFEGQKKAFIKRPELIKVKGQPDVIDTVLYTLHGPVMYDKSFHGPGGLQKPLALMWMAHRSTNELASVYALNRARNYIEFTNAIQLFQCPAQNMVYADREGNIAIWGQGQFVNKWPGQGKYVMNGTKEATLWGGNIPVSENPAVLNPPQGFVSSANQVTTDSTYPYWYNGYFYDFRAWRINNVLSGLQGATIEDMFALQNDVYSTLAANVLPVMLRYMGNVNDDNIKELRSWNYRLEAESKAATVFQLWSSQLAANIWKDDFGMLPDNFLPSPERTMRLLQTDTTLKYYDDIRTQQVETLGDIVRKSYTQALDTMKVHAALHGDQWHHVKNTSVKHLTKIPAFSYSDLKVGGWGNVPNAMKGTHGPSWRMVVQMGKEIEAYGVYPGGQSGNPGNPHYADFLDDWVTGKYFRLVFLPNKAEQDKKNIKYTWTAQPQK